jgi:hypothetical protein
MGRPRFGTSPGPTFLVCARPWTLSTSATSSTRLRNGCFPRTPSTPSRGSRANKPPARQAVWGMGWAGSDASAPPYRPFSRPWPNGVGTWRPTGPACATRSPGPAAWRWARAPSRGLVSMSRKRASNGWGCAGPSKASCTCWSDAWLGSPARYRRFGPVGAVRHRLPYDPQNGSTPN